MINFIELVQDPDFRNYAMSRLANNSKKKDYFFPEKYPKLFRYRSLTSYAIDDIINEQVSVTTIGEFNDLFDGSVHLYGDNFDRDAAAESKWSELEKIRKMAELPEEIFSHDYYTDFYKKHFEEDSRHKFNLLDYLGTFVCCFSTELNATLMWSHYADSSKGICISYDFNQWESKALQRKLLFPVAYSHNPIDLSDLMEEGDKRPCKYPIDTALLCAALNKAEIWDYESEWRLLFVTTSFVDRTRRMSINILVKPSAVYFGYHFLKTCFYYDSKNNVEREASGKNIKNIDRLLEYLDKNHISTFLMLPSIGSYAQKSKSIDARKLQGFIKRHFHNSMAKDMRYYSVIQNNFVESLVDN